MPKLLENIREDILQAAKKELLAKGYEKCSLRSVARQCKIAVGTIYNYFPSKLELVAVIMLEDWNHKLRKMVHDCGNANSAEGGFSSIYTSLREFTALYQDVWNMSTNTKEVMEELANSRSRHQLLIGQLAGIIHSMLERFEMGHDLFLSRFIANALLSYAMEPEDEMVRLNEIFGRIIKCEV